MGEVEGIRSKWLTGRGTVVLYVSMAGLVWLLGVSGTQAVIEKYEGGSVAERLADKACSERDFRAEHMTECAALDNGAAVAAAEGAR